MEARSDTFDMTHGEHTACLREIKRHSWGEIHSLGSDWSNHMIAKCHMCIS